jgi:uncharacterized protein with HEPN domain
MPRDPRAFLWDARDAADAIATFIKGRTLAEYLSDRLLRSAVERQCEIVGEALNRPSRHAPELAALIPALPRAVAFRNLLIHGYATVDDATVWRTVIEDMPLLAADVTPACWLSISGQVSWGSRISTHSPQAATGAFRTNSRRAAARRFVGGGRMRAADETVPRRKAGSNSEESEFHPIASIGNVQGSHGVRRPVWL